VGAPSHLGYEGRKKRVITASWSRRCAGAD